MKCTPTVLLLTLATLVSCDSPNSDSNSYNTDSPPTTQKTTILPDSVLPSDSSSIEIADGLEISDNIIVQIKKTTPWLFANSQLQIKSLIRLNDKAFYIMYEINDGVSLKRYIMTFFNNTYKDHEILELGMDGDLSFPRYEYSELRQLAGDKFQKVHFVETPFDKNTIDPENGLFKEGFNFDNVKIKTDSITIMLGINSDATISRDTIGKAKIQH